MTLNTIFPFAPTLVIDSKQRQGRSKKTLRPVIQFDGRVYVAYFEGRPNRFFGASSQEAHNNLQAGGA